MKSAIILLRPRAVTARFENDAILLLVQPPKKFLKALVGENFFHGIKIIRGVRCASRSCG